MNTNINSPIDRLIEANHDYMIAMSKLNIAIEKTNEINFNLVKSYPNPFAGEKLVNYEIHTWRGLDDSFDTELCALINKHLKKKPIFLPAMIYKTL